MTDSKAARGPAEKDLLARAKFDDAVVDELHHRNRDGGACCVAVDIGRYAHALEIIARTQG